MSRRPHPTSGRTWLEDMAGLRIRQEQPAGPARARLAPEPLPPPPSAGRRWAGGGTRFRRCPEVPEVPERPPPRLRARRSPSVTGRAAVRASTASRRSPHARFRSRPRSPGPSLPTVKVVAPPGPVARGQAALGEAHLLGPGHLPRLQQGLVHQRVLQGAQERGQLPVGAPGRVQLRGAEESLEGHVGGGHTAGGGVVLAGERGVRAQQVLQGRRLQLGGHIGGAGEPSKIWNWGRREGGASARAPDTPRARSA